MQVNGHWFKCPGCTRVVTSLIKGVGPCNQDYYSSTHCCKCCEGTCTTCKNTDGHCEERWACAGVPHHMFGEIFIPKVGEYAHYLIHEPPERRITTDVKSSNDGEIRSDMRLPAVLFLHGAATYNYPESLWQDVRDLVENNLVVQERFVVIAPLATAGEPLAVVTADQPKRKQKKDRFGNLKDYVDSFNEDLAFQTFLGACVERPRTVDLSRLHVVGLSMGGQSAWNCAMHYGSKLAGVVSMAGFWSWEGAHYRKILEELRGLPLRCFSGEADNSDYIEDLSWLAGRRGFEAPSREWSTSVLTGKWKNTPRDVRVIEWGESLQMCIIEGMGHNCWQTVFHNEGSFKLFTWLESLRCASASSASSTKEDWVRRDSTVVKYG